MILKAEREQAIADWEKKWGRKHPSRKNNSKLNKNTDTNSLSEKQK